MQEFYLTPKNEMKALAPFSTSKPALRALSRQRWCGDPDLWPLGPAFSPWPQQSSFFLDHSTTSQLSALVEQLYWRVEGSRRAYAGSPAGRPQLRVPPPCGGVGAVGRHPWCVRTKGSSGQPRLALCVTRRGTVSMLGSGKRDRKIVS